MDDIVKALRDQCDYLSEAAADEIGALRALIADRRPTVHEIAPMLVAGMLANRTPDWERLAVEAYRGAEALVAEGRRRDGNG